MTTIEPDVVERLVERLTDYADQMDLGECEIWSAATREAATLLAQQQARIEDLEGVLWPFSLVLKGDDSRTSDAAMVVCHYGMRKLYGLSLGDLRRARAAKPFAKEPT